MKMYDKCGDLLTQQQIAIMWKNKSTIKKKIVRYKLRVKINERGKENIIHNKLYGLKCDLHYLYKC